MFYVSSSICYQPTRHRIIITTKLDHLVDEDLESQFGVDGVGFLDDAQQPAQSIFQWVILSKKGIHDTIQQYSSKNVVCVPHYR